MLTLYVCVSDFIGLGFELFYPDSLRGYARQTATARSPWQLSFS